MITLTDIKPKKNMKKENYRSIQEENIKTLNNLINNLLLLSIVINSNNKFYFKLY